MNWFVFLYNLHKTEETLLSMKKIWSGSYCLNTSYNISLATLNILY
jgi:hypothetical protein